MKPLPPFILINKDGAALPEFKAINRAAYWDYQRQRVYVRSSKVIKKACQKTLKRKVKGHPVKHTLGYFDPASCTYCGGVALIKSGTTDVFVHDIRFTHSGVKGWVDSTCKVAGKIHSVTTGYTRGGELAKRAAYVDSGTTEFLSTIKLIAFRTENMMIRILSERIPDYESADSILRDIFKGLADLVPEL
jgi:hypothetical protein